MAKKIAIFNHKGGVSKTTTTYHLAWALANLGKKVLMIDADSQCNLTLMALGEDNYETFYRDFPERNIKSALTPAFKAQTKLLKAVDCVRVKDNPNIFLLPGHLDLGEYEVQLAFSFQLNGFGTMQNLPGSFNSLFEKTAETIGADYILIDMNPSLSAINQDLLISSDYFIVPTSPDYFSSMAIKSLSMILPQWEKWAVSARQIFSDAVYPLPTNTPKFLGYTVNDFSLRKGKPGRNFQMIIDELNTEIKNELIPKLRNAGMLLSEDLYSHNYLLAQVANFASLMPKSQEYGLPVFELSDKQIGLNGPPLDTQKEMAKRFRQEFNQFAERVINLTTVNDTVHTAV